MAASRDSARLKGLEAGRRVMDSTKRNDRDRGDEDPVLTEIVRRLIGAYEPERIYLLGSAARDERGPDSDYHLPVIVRDGAPPDRRRSRLAYEVLRGTGVAATVLLEGRLLHSIASRRSKRA